jgi:chemotaxis protein methyltransferase CheR
MPVSAQEVDAVFTLVHELCGIALDNSKSYLVESRLGELVRSQGCKNYEELVRNVRLGADTSLKTSFIDAMTTNETLFFRDDSPFDALKFTALPETIDARSKTAFPKRLRIWSAACSTGQEPYSIAMTIAEMIPDFAKWDIQIVGTDICDRALKQASLGEYSAFEIERGMKPVLLGKYFQKVGAAYKVRDSLRAMCVFRPLNLTGPMSNFGQFDIVFCRNVVIYFDAATRRELFRRIAETILPEGYLFVGAQESLADLGAQFAPHRHCRSTYYRPNLTRAPENLLGNSPGVYVNTAPVNRSSPPLA